MHGSLTVVPAGTATAGEMSHLHIPSLSLAATFTSLGD